MVDSCAVALHAMLQNTNGVEIVLRNVAELKSGKTDCVRCCINNFRSELKQLSCVSLEKLYIAFLCGESPSPS